MVFCLLLGSILLIATVVSFPLYRSAAFDRMVRDEFQNYLSQEGVWPGLNKMVTTSKKDAGGKSMLRMEEVLGSLPQTLGVTEKETICYYSLAEITANSTMNRADMSGTYMRLSMYTDLPKHARILYGQMYSETGISEEGAIEVIISQASMVKNNLLLNEILTMEGLKGPDGKNIKIKVVGIFEEEDSKDFYWQVKPENMSNVCMMNEALFREYFTKDNAGKYTITCTYFQLFEYEDLSAEMVPNLSEKTKWLTEESGIKSTVSKPEYVSILESYMKKQDRIEATLFILQIPVLILLAAFLFMISGQMYDMEKNEISVMKSRGASSGQMFRLYLFQSIFLTLIGAAAGIPLGTVFCRILGSTQNFLEFNIRRQLEIRFSQDVWMYALAAIGLSILIMTIPALKHSRLTIVKLKQSNALRNKSWWEKIFLDVICIGVSMYGYYSYSKSKDLMIQNVLEGKSLDPLLYMSSSLFIVGMGLLFLRLQPILIRVVYAIGKPFWKPASYASFMENSKNGRKQQFIMLFMILTISLGMYHATVARTILQNAQNNAEYLEAVDIILQEKWADNSASMGSGSETTTLQYIEPDYTKFAGIPGVERYTKVLFDKKAAVKVSGKSYTDCTLMGIHTKEFGLMTSVSDDLLEKPYYQYLNELAAEPKGVLVSRNFETLMGCKVGDSVDYKNAAGVATTGKIIDFFDYWPGYTPTTMSLNNEGSLEKTENFLVIANISRVQEQLGVYPYQVWINFKAGADHDVIYDWIDEHNIRISADGGFRDRETQIQNVLEDPLLQGTNGVLTMGFIVTIILCGVGYLIYWIMSIRSREMLFGVLRACGMHKGELFHMLINEQIFSGVLSILAGIGIGTATSKMFVPMLQNAYAASNQVLPMELITNPVDMYRLYGVVAGVMALCLFVLLMLVFKLNVAKALKLGEE